MPQSSVEPGLLLCRRTLASQCRETAFDVCPPLAQEPLAPAELREFDKPSLVGVQEALGLAVQVGQGFLQRVGFVREAVLRPRRGLRLEPRIAGEQHGGVLEMPADFGPNEGIHGVRVQVPLGAAPERRAGPEHVVALAVVIVVVRPVPASGDTTSPGHTPDSARAAGGGSGRT
jgi:hypothetical protein